jgi:hypothetical protein
LGWIPSVDALRKNYRLKWEAKSLPFLSSLLFSLRETGAERGERKIHPSRQAHPTICNLSMNRSLVFVRGSGFHRFNELSQGLLGNPNRRPDPDHRQFSFRDQTVCFSHAYAHDLSCLGAGQ